MRRVDGPTDRVIVIGAGLAGLSAALHLAGSGRNVTVLERSDRPGGRAGRLELGGYRFDTGPTVLTMPDVIAETFAAVGANVDDWLELIRLDPAYRAHYPDGSVLDVRADPAATAQEIRRVCGSREAAGFLRYVDYVTRLYTVQYQQFIARNLDSPLDILTPGLATLLVLGGFRSWAGKLRQFFGDPRTERLFGFQALYAGLSPYDARALYAVISYLDTVGGVFVPRGGMYALPRALATLAARHGVHLRYRTTVERIVMHGGRASAVVTTDGERVTADVVVVTADLPVAVRDLLPGPAPQRVIRPRAAPSCMLLLVGSSARYAGAAHHNLHFGRRWRSAFEELAAGALMSDPSVLVTIPTHTEPDLAPDGRHSYYILVPTPNLEAGLDWRTLGPRYRDETIETLERRGYRGFGEAIEVEHRTTPADWRRLGLDRGTPFAAAHTFRQTGPFRPPTLPHGLDNVVFAGSGTQPGVGVPMALISGRLAAERVTLPGGPAARFRRNPRKSGQVSRN